MPFNGIPNLRDANEPVKLDIDKLREIKKCALDPIYFIRNYVYINTKDNGMQLFDLYDFQEAAIKRFLKYRFNINKWSRQVGKSTIVRGFILWWGIFHKDQLIAMIGNKLSLAKEQMQQLRDSYSRLPTWLQPGVKLWNKTSIQFSNNSRIIVSSSSPDNIRGFSINLLYLDEFAFLRPNLATEFIASVMPSISSGKTTRCIITSTPNGMNHFYDMWQTSLELDQAEAEFEKGNNDLYVRSVVTWDKVPGRTEAWANAEKLKIGDQRFRQEYECEFVGSGITLIDYRCLETLKASDPLPFDNSLWPPALAEIVKDISIRTFKYPEPAGAMEAKGYSYAASIDTAYGMRQDYHVLQITKVYSNIKCEQVFTMSSNCTEVSDFCRIANIILKFYHNPYLIIEYNGPGKSTYDYFFNVAMYPNIINFDLHARGLWATPTMKNNVVILLKMYVQRGYIKLHDYNTIMELMTFTKKTQNTWGGGGNTHDDHVTSLYWIIYFLNSTYYYGNFEEIENLSETEMLRLSEEMRNRYADALDFVKSPDAMAEQHKLGALAEASV
ncbi:MAG: terminase family protein [Bacteroidaceae bacterium]|nr:terminase family protein [Bacteroidaceae bacterium]